MFLKRLDVVGFKSFADRISVDFVSGVTAVVGPNGSGKSNITDAIRWVLGEQSARSLRGAKMEDIIFAGSDTRKALNVAEVTLTLQNEDQFLPVDYNEVSVTRRVYRSGESEFYINKQSCRLKDIVDLFMDSGLGREAFSIISQGKVEEILSSKPEDRRTIFEEAAGVLKYKTRKKKAEMKLMESQENLNRVEDILHEIEGQIDPLRMQSSMAKDFLEKKKELEQTEVALTVYEIEHLHANWKELLISLDKHKDDEIKLSSFIQKEEVEIEKMREYVQVLDESINDLQEVLLITSQDLEKLEGKKQVLRERKKNVNQNQSQLENKINDLKVKMEYYEKALIEEKEKLQQFHEELENKAKSLREVQQKFEIVDQDIESEIEQLKAEYIDILNKQASYRNEIKYLKDQIDQQTSKKGRLQTNNEKYVQERKVIQTKKQNLKEALISKQKELNKNIALKKEREALLINTREQYEKKQTQLYKAYQFIQQFRSKKEMLEEMQEDYSGFFHGVKEILKANLQGVEGAVAELIKVKKDYEIAIEIALGGAMQHVVVETEQNARGAIQYLKQNRSGRATFLPLSVIKSRTIPDNQLNLLKSQNAFVGIASNLVKFDNRYTNIVENLLGHVIVTSDLKGANEIAKLLNYRYRIVTLEGDVVNPGGSMTGGTVKQKSNSLLSRQRELEEVSNKLMDAEKKTALFEEQVKTLKADLSNNELENNKLKDIVEQERLDEQTITSQIREVEIEEKNVNEKLSLYDYEMKSFRDDEKSIKQRQSELSFKLDQSVTVGREYEKNIEILTEQKRSAQQSKESLQAEMTELKVTVAREKQQLSNQHEKVERLQEEFEDASFQMTVATDDLRFLTDEVDSNRDGEGKIEEEIKLKEQEKQKTISLISNRRDERLKIQMTLEDKERETKELKRQQKQATTLLKDEEVKVNRLDVELENRLNHLREEYALTFEAAKEKYPLTLEVEEARKTVKLIKKSIDELGTVNLGAIEEYDRISERYSFLSEQKEDLMKAKETLHQVISEMDEEMKKRFESYFYSIKAEFEQVFTKLFGGGRADLQLTDPDDLLNTGVDIVAQPPGKNLQNLSLLSGGERALTAIALLFAILQVRPVPFCVLDEVEAALDDANVNRFALYLKKYSSETQFIVITHRKGTMEEADVLYGVTMQESGVSSLVSVKLEESKELLETT